MERGPIGPAADFYRLRLRSLDAIGEPDLEWREDTWYRAQTAEVPSGRLSYLIEAVELDDPDTAHVVASSADYDEALALRAHAQEDLDELTRSRFEAIWIRQGVDETSDLSADAQD